MRTMAAYDPERRRAASAAGGHARKAKAGSAVLTASGRAGAAAVNGPAGLARRIVKKWPELGRAERAEVRAILAEIMPRQR